MYSPPSLLSRRYSDAERELGLTTAAVYLAISSFPPGGQHCVESQAPSFKLMPFVYILLDPENHDPCPLSQTTALDIRLSTEMHEGTQEDGSP